MPPYRLLTPTGPVLSEAPGTLGGNGDAKIYGRLDCSSALRALRQGDHYRTHRVFFADEATAIASGYRPCGNCMRSAYKVWKAEREAAATKGP
jgi:hypothetical protein